MTAGAQAAALESLQWEADRRRAAMEAAQRAADAADIRRSEADAERAAEARPRPDAETAEFVRRMTGAPEPLDLPGTLAKIAMLAPAEAPGRDRGAEYGSVRNPAVFIEGREVAEPVRRSDGWPESEAVLDRMIEQDRAGREFMTRYLARRDYPAALARARARQSEVSERYISR